MRAGLIVIDGQVDFCDVGPGQNKDGRLSVKGASAAMERVHRMITNHYGDIDELSVTFDCHYHHHIAHARMWKDKNGNPPNPYTQIMFDDVCGKNPIWFSSNPVWQSYLEAYITELRSRNEDRQNSGFPRIEHTIWPEHCVPDTDGFALQMYLSDAVLLWETKRNYPARRVTKGSNIFREHFSAFKAEVPDHNDPSTKPQLKLAENIIKDLDIMFWAGIAEDYCLMNSFIDFIEMLAMNDDQKRKSLASKMVFLEDGTAPVGVVPSLKQFFWDYMNKWGVTITTTDQAFK
jgi:nicotinamidase/pyrazinamidase